MVDPATLVKAGVAVPSNEKTRKEAGWAVVADLSPIILLVAFFCSLGSAASGHNITAVELCFHGGPIPAETPAEYRAYIEKMRGTIQCSEDRVARLLFKLTVEISMMMHVLAAGLEIDSSQLDALRGRCVQEVKKTSGTIAFKDTLLKNRGDEP